MPSLIFSKLDDAQIEKLIYEELKTSQARIEDIQGIILKIMETNHELVDR